MSTEHLLGDIGAILSALNGIANEPRREAELHLQKLTVEQPAEVLLLLAQIGALAVGGFQLDERFLSLILLKSLAFKPLPGLYLNSQHQLPSAPFDVIRETTRGRIETVLCAGLKDELDPRIRKGLGMCSASWAEESHKRKRPARPFVPVCLELTQSPNAFHRFTSFQLLGYTPTLVDDAADGPLSSSQLTALLLTGLEDSSVDVRLEAIKATKSLLIRALTHEARDEVGEVLIQASFQTLQNLPQDLVPIGLIPLVELASIHPKLFISSLSLIITKLLPLLSPPSQGRNLPPYAFSPYPAHDMTLEAWEAFANPATELLLSLAEMRPNEFEEFENGRALSEMVGLLLGREVATFEMDCQEWMEEEDLDEEDVNYPVFPEEALDRLSVAASYTDESMEIIYSSLLKHVQALLQQEDWRCRFAALMGVGCVAEAFGDAIVDRDILSQVFALPKITDYGRDTLHIILHLLDDPVMRVRVHAAASLTTFFEGEEHPEIVGEVLDRIVRGCVGLYEAGPMYAKDQALATLGTVAMAAKDMFRPYYRNLMDLCFQIMSAQLGASKEERVVQGGAIECGYMLAIALGGTNPGDALKFVQLLLSIQNTIVDEDDPRSRHLMDAWEHMCDSLGQQFAPFLQYVIPPLLKTAFYRPQKASPNADDEDDPYWGDELSDKAEAFKHLGFYASKMRESFAPWLAQSMGLCLEELNHPYAESVKNVAAYLVPALLAVAKESGAWNTNPENYVQAFRQLIKAMVNALDISVISILFKSFKDALRVVHTPFPPDLTRRLLKASTAIVYNLAQARADRKEQEPYMDETDHEYWIEEQLEEDQCLKRIEEAVDGIVIVGGSEEGQAMGALSGGIENDILGLKALIRKVGAQKLETKGYDDDDDDNETLRGDQGS
ncbi:hypothetical protein L198_07996 [Cryptococcus wingfieldii CBS 7118]|uniref:IPO4/5-like TPR repeats domain-containing protein n=1 Tax=Cryptococcus wingfieldii CBS 7118 TaxID=1295528 RepID=A0A1E3HP19_9TREE|nr:hypothetical protein L198_07996 [Cryptococcus wingfieldii CBS 7118]ODN78077.1 hypothetical protein L198_07996 [Cryptococcus wingfieldii CBS 7118]